MCVGGGLLNSPVGAEYCVVPVQAAVSGIQSDRVRRGFGVLWRVGGVYLQKTVHRQGGVEPLVRGGAREEGCRLQMDLQSDGAEHARSA